MEQEQLQGLITEAEKQGGGLVLNIGDTPQAVVLSVAAYTQLLAGRSGMVPGLQAVDEANVVAPELQRTVLVVGGAGYLGSFVCRELLRRGSRVIILDNLSTGSREQVPVGATFVQGDVADKNVLRDIFAEYQVTTVVHTALPQVEAEGVEVLHSAALGMYSLVMAMHEAGVFDLVCVSDICVYGTEQLRAVTPATGVLPVGAYAEGVMLAELVVQYASKFLNLRSRILRFAAIAGADLGQGLSGSCHRHGFIPKLLRVARGVSTSIVIDGSDWQTNDGTYVRDYIAVTDAATACVLAAHKPFESGYELYTLGSGKGVTVREVIQAVAETTRRMIPMELGPRMPTDAERLLADPQLFCEAFDFALIPKTIHELVASEWETKAEQEKASLASTASEAIEA
ncbi:MAG: UDP-glucose 4-epimerase [Candidatus Doudnabacteria bacterium]|nr:UDP-glucose 4-epimerase [Candidatus Doudnabacteria bacterium]